MKVVLDKTMQLSQLENIDNLAYDGEANEIEALDVLTLFPENIGGRVLKNWIAKLAHKGTLTLSCTDLIHIAKLLSLRAISVAKANEVLFGTNGTRKSAYCNATLAASLEACGLKILKNRTEGCKTIIVAERP